MEYFNGLGMNLGNLSRLSRAKSRSICAENKNGEKGRAAMAVPEGGSARELGVGWKVSPCISIPAKTAVTLAEIEGPGAIQQMWFTTFPGKWRSTILRIYWDGEETPSVETPYGDFFLNGWCERSNVSSLPIAVNPAGGMNCYFEMPFRKSAKVTIENLDDDETCFFYQINYTLTEVPADCAYFHAQ